MTAAILQQTGLTFGARTTQIGWFAAGTVIAFLLPFVFSSALELHHDAYYAVYFAGALVFLAAYIRATGADVAAFSPPLQRRRPPGHHREHGGPLPGRNAAWSLGIGLLSAAFVVFNVLNREDSTPRPDGAYFVFELGWRGLAYGAIDALLLTAFPALVAFSLLEKRIAGLGRRAMYAGVTLALVAVITAAYHLGYEQFREDGVGAPEIGNAIISVPALATANPLGSIVAHASMHVAAVTHAYETDVYLPPQTDAE